MTDHTDDQSDPRDEHQTQESSADGGRSTTDQQEAGKDASGSEREGRDARRRVRHEQRHHRRRDRHDRKERVLHTRISEQLSEDIRRLADDLRVPTSNLVRNVLEEVFTVVESVTDDVGDLFEDVLEEAGSARERVRRRSRHRARHRSSREPRSSSWADVAEDEIRHDEAMDAESGPARSAGAAADEEASRAGASRRAREDRPPPPAFEEVIGWQPLVLNQTQDCSSCGHSIRRGSRAFVGQTDAGLSRIALCRQCLHDR